MHGVVYGTGAEPGDTGELLSSEPGSPGPRVAGSVREKSVPVAVGAGVVGRPDGSGLRRGAADRGWPWLLASVTVSFCLGSRGCGPGGVSLS